MSLPFGVGGSYCAFVEEDLDSQLLRFGPVVLFWKKEVLTEATSSLTALGYRFLSVEYKSGKQFQRELSEQMRWQQLFGYEPWNGNLDAFNDGLRDEPFSSSDRSALCIRRFDRLVEEDSAYAQALLDIIAHQSWQYLLNGKRLLALIQTNDSKYQPEMVGGSRPSWNPSEWLDEERR